MPFLVASMWGGLALVLSSLVGRVLLALGLSYVTFSGLNVGVDFIVLTMRENYGNIGGEAGAFIRWLWIDRALSMIVSAFAAALAIKTSTGAVTKMVFKK